MKKSPTITLETIVKRNYTVGLRFEGSTPHERRENEKKPMRSFDTYSNR